MSEANGMSASGHSGHVQRTILPSIATTKADVCAATNDVGEGPIADILPAGIA
jgi:hypothetical protein